MIRCQMIVSGNSNGVGWQMYVSIICWDVNFVFDFIFSPETKLNICICRFGDHLDYHICCVGLKKNLIKLELEVLKRVEDHWLSYEFWASYVYFI